MQELSHWLKALADPTRLRLLWLLGDGEAHCVCQLTEALALPQPTVSRHLRTLREARLVQGRRQGTWTHYSLVVQPSERQPVLDALLATMAALPEAATLRAACSGSHGRCAS